jgi:hypothetical protein
MIRAILQILSAMCSEAYRPACYEVLVPMNIRPMTLGAITGAWTKISGEMLWIVLH